jgi:hypothetical protein
MASTITQVLHQLMRTQRLQVRAVYAQYDPLDAQVAASTNLSSPFVTNFICRLSGVDRYHQYSSPRTGQTAVRASVSSETLPTALRPLCTETVSAAAAYVHQRLQHRHKPVIGAVQRRPADWILSSIARHAGELNGMLRDLAVHGLSD